MPVILIAAVIQGWALYALHQAVKQHHWPATEPAWLMGLYAVAVFLPLTVELLADYVKSTAHWTLVAVIGAAAFYFGWHHGAWIADNPLTDRSAPWDFFALGFVLTVLWLLVLPFVQARLAEGRWSIDYRILFANAWRNKITLLEASVFTGVFWLLLFLWESLFHMLQINFFRDLFEEPLFVYPVTALVFGCALHLIGTIDRLVSAVLEQILNVLKWLATVAGLMLGLFTIALLLKLPSVVFTGQSSVGATWLLWLVAVMVLLLNAAFRDGTVERPYPQWIAFSLRIIVPLTMVISSTAVYALVVRTQHYGLTVERVWAFVVAGAALLYSAGYSVAAFGKGGWLGGAARVNVIVALALIATLAAALTPLLSPYRLAADSQYRLILAGRFKIAATPADRDTPFHYLRFDSGQYGRQALELLAQLKAHPDAGRIRQLAAQAMKQQTRWEAPASPKPDVVPDALLGRIHLYPSGRTLDADLRAKLTADCPKEGNFIPCTEGSQHTLAGIFVDLNGDGREEFVLLENLGGIVYENQPGGWQYIGHVTPAATPGSPGSRYDFETELSKGNITTAVPQWKILSVGRQTFRVEEPQ